MKPAFPFLVFCSVLAAHTSFADAEPPRPPALPAVPASPAEPAPPVPPLPPHDILLAQGAELSFEGLVEPHMERAIHMLTSKRGSGVGRSLVVPANAADAEQAREMEEDLNVMARVLEKAAASANEDSGEFRSAMGIELQWLGKEAFGSAAPPRNLYLEGYGALFFLGVKFPLLAPPKEESDNRPAKEPTSTTWEEARADVYGERRPGSGRQAGRTDFDQGKVDDFKESLLDAIKNAKHIRHLKPNETISVIVMGESIRAERGKRVSLTWNRDAAGGGFGGGGPDNANVFKRVEPRPAPTRGDGTLLVRVKKSDAEAFAGDKMTTEEFRKKATILVY